MSQYKKTALGYFAAFLIAFWVGGGVFYYLATHSVSGKNQTEIVNISTGMTLRKISNSLEDRNLIRNAISFQLLAYLQKKQGQIQAGEYELSPSMTPKEILLKVTSGKTVLHAVTIPEGYRITEIADLLAERGLADREKFIRQTRDMESIQSLGIPGNSLEGYLFPETYHFSKNTPEQKIIQKMTDTFKKRVADLELMNRAKVLNLSLHQVIILASIIEKETGLDKERKTISSVFHNRLKINMLLQTDPSVIYAIQSFDGNIRKKDLSIDSPYNTYKYKGLPPGPIASPGLQSIIAALDPSETGFLYFVSRKDGSHQFSLNLPDHNLAVQKYQLRRIANSVRR